MKTTYKIAIGVGLAAILGGAAYMYFRKPKEEDKNSIVDDILDKLKPETKPTVSAAPPKVKPLEVDVKNDDVIATTIKQSVVSKVTPSEVAKSFAGDIN